METTVKTHIHLLPPEEAKKIAAGEVINRPAALAREFMDNALDAGGSLIELLIEGGGILKTEVIDDGVGMEREDLELCWYPHATSKIRSLEDLNTAATLGFRGEALAAAVAVARLEILTSPDGREAWLLGVGPGEGGIEIQQTRRARGSNVRALGLFDTIPARKHFLKREGSEANLCRQAFIDKALAFPGVSFRFIQDGKLKLFLPRAASLRERFAQALLGRAEGGGLHEIATVGEGFSVTIVAGGPELYRQDRRQQYVFANGRRIMDFSLIQALEYGLQGWFPNGARPVGAVYVTIEPALADFNIHPAKQEVRFADPGAVHHGITAALRDYSRRRHLIPAEKFWDNDDPAPEGGEGEGSLALKALLEDSFEEGPDRRALEALGGLAVAEAPPPYRGRNRAVRLVGRLFDLFLLVERGEKLFIIDQHAAHERIIYNRLVSGLIPTQELLVPIPFTTEEAKDDWFLNRRREDLARLGLVIRGEGNGLWRIEALPAGWRLGDTETVAEILKLQTAGEDMVERWLATLSCHGAVRDGDYLDDAAALALAEAALGLPMPRCPHGRPVWVEISRDDLFRAVRRLR